MNPQQNAIFVELDYILNTKGIRTKKKNIESALWLINSLRGRISSLEGQLHGANKRTQEYCNLFSKLDHVKNIEVKVQNIYDDGIQGFMGYRLCRNVISNKETIIIELQKLP